MKNDDALELSKEFPVTVEELYKAWTSPEELKQWWTPMGKKLTDVENNVKEGGSIKYSAKDADTPLVIKGEYKEVKENEKLVYTWDFNFSNETFEEHPYKLTIEFSGNGDSSTLSVKQKDLKNDEMVEVQERGWEEQLENLRNYLREKNS